MFLEEANDLVVACRFMTGTGDEDEGWGIGHRSAGPLAIHDKYISGLFFSSEAPVKLGGRRPWLV